MTLADLTRPAPTTLSDARLQLHWAVQAVSAMADRYVTARADDGHTNLEWRADLGLALGNPTPSGLRVGVRPDPFELVAVKGGEVRATMPLAGRTLESICITEACDTGQ